MFRSLFLFTLLFLATTVRSDPLHEYFQLLDMEEPVKEWIHKLQPSSPTDTKNVITNHLLFNSATHDIPLELLIGLITVESRFNTRAVSSHGAKGLTQVMPRYHKTKINGRDIFDPRVGIEVGSLVLRDCLNKHHGNHLMALSCYSGSKGAQAVKYQQSVLTQTKRFQNHTMLLRKPTGQKLALLDL